MMWGRPHKNSGIQVVGITTKDLTRSKRKRRMTRKSPTKDKGYKSADFRSSAGPVKRSSV